MQKGLSGWQHTLHVANASVGTRAIWHAQEYLHQSRLHSLILFHQQQAEKQQTSRILTSFGGLAHARVVYHKGVHGREMGPTRLAILFAKAISYVTLVVMS